MYQKLLQHSVLNILFLMPKSDQEFSLVQYKQSGSKNIMNLNIPVMHDA